VLGPRGFGRRRALAERWRRSKQHNHRLPGREPPPPPPHPPPPQQQQQQQQYLGTCNGVVFTGGEGWGEKHTVGISRHSPILWFSFFIYFFFLFYFFLQYTKGAFNDARKRI